MAFEAEIKAQLRGSLVRAARLVKMEFKSETVRLWEGTGNLKIGSDVYSSLDRGLLEISEIEVPLGDVAPQYRVSITGVNPADVARARNASEEVQGRPITIYRQHFDDDTKTLGDPLVMLLGVMDVIRVRGSVASASVEVTVETPFTRRAVPPFGWLTSSDQNGLFPGDRGLDFVPRMVSKDVAWPVF